MKVPKVNPKTCIGCGTCTALCPKTFELNSEFKAEVINPPGDPEDKIQEMIDTCPTQAITWEK